MSTWAHVACLGEQLSLPSMSFHYFHYCRGARDTIIYVHAGDLSTAGDLNTAPIFPDEFLLKQPHSLHFMKPYLKANKNQNI